MAKDDFDINFDFDQDYEFDPKAFLADGEYDENMDDYEIPWEKLNLDLDAEESQASSEEVSAEIPGDEISPEAAADEFDLDFDLDALLNMGEEPQEEFTDEELMADVPEFAQRSRNSQFDMAGYGAPPELPTDYTPSQYEDDVPSYGPEAEESCEGSYEEGYDPAAAEESSGEVPPEDPQNEEKQGKRSRRRKEPKEPKVKVPKEPREPKPIVLPAFLQKFIDIYFTPVLKKETFEEPQDPNNPRRRRRKSKVQIFKEVYLPPIVVCLTLILVLTFAIGSLSNLIEQKKLEADTEKSRLDSSASAVEQEASAAQASMEQATALATTYQYAEAITVLDSFLNSVEDTTAFPEVTALRSDYVSAQSQLVSHQDPSLIPNLSFHVLVHDMAKAKLDLELGGLYNRNFVTTSEFTKILGELYNNGYVLVDFDSFTTNSNGTILPKNIELPPDKKPIMLTETMVNYFEYMVDSNGDGEPDSGGDGFANKLVIDANGDIKAEYIDSNNNALVGDYDFVPILETFLKEHPDFSYKGARAILAVTGSEGIFGYRVNTTYQADKGQAYRDEQVAGAKQLVQTLRNKGYTMACFTYDNKKYGDMNANQITDDLTQWTQQITPILGEVDVMVYARESDISDYSGNAFTVMSTSGFRYFVSNAASPSTEVNSTYVRQKRLMVTGNSLAWKQDMFSGIFDPNSVIDLTTRGSVPN